MVLFNKLGSLVRHSSFQKWQASMAFMLSSPCFMSSSKLFVGGLSYGVDDQTLKDAFSAFGNVINARVITDRDSGRSRGFGFVDFDDDKSASSALSEMDGQELNGRNIRISYANDRPTASQSLNDNRNFRGENKW